MSPEVFYKPVRSIPVAGHTWEDVDGLTLPKTGIPLKDGHIDQLSRFVVKSRGDNQTSPQLVQISPAEKRTFELQVDSFQKVIFQDEFGNLFAVLDSKGNKATIIKVKKLSTSPSAFNFWGMLESDSTTRAVKASEYLRALNIDTDIILKVIEPDQIPYKGGMFTQEEFKTQLFKETVEQARSNSHRTKINSDQIKAEDLPKLSLALEGMSFVQTIRGKQVNERLIDLENATPEAMRKMMGNAFWFQNFRDAKLQDFIPLDPDNHEDVEKYFRHILPNNIGDNYGDLHNAGLLHIHPHLQNISLIGAICDTDSITGEPLGLGDAPITEDEKLIELRKLLYGYWNPREGQGLVPLFFELMREGKIPVTLEDRFTFVENIEANLIINYAYTRGWQNDWLANLDKINKILDHPNRTMLCFLPTFILGQLHRENLWNYTLKIDSTDAIATEMFKQGAPFWKKYLPRMMRDQNIFSNILAQAPRQGGPIIKQRISEVCAEGLDSIKQSHGEVASQAVIDLVTLPVARDFALTLLEQIHVGQSNKSKDENAKKYILNAIKA